MLQLLIGRKRSKSVELLAYIFDHVVNKSVNGFNLLTIGWTDGFSFIPVAFNMLSSAKQEKRFKEINPKIDKRTNGYKARMSAIMKKPDAALQMIRSALDAGISARYILMDTWFTNEPFIKNILSEGLDVIGMLYCLTKLTAKQPDSRTAICRNFSAINFVREYKKQQANVSL